MVSQHCYDYNKSLLDGECSVTMSNFNLPNPISVTATARRQLEAWVPAISERIMVNVHLGWLAGHEWVLGPRRLEAVDARPEYHECIAIRNTPHRESWDRIQCLNEIYGTVSPMIVGWAPVI